MMPVAAESLPDGTIGYAVRGTDDCFCACVATVLQVPIGELPVLRLDERMAAGWRPEDVNRAAWRELKRWLSVRALRLVGHKKVPVDAARWIGIVPLAGWFQSHCLAVCGETVFDPARLLLEHCARIVDEELQRFEPSSIPASLLELAGPLLNPDARDQTWPRWRLDHVRYGFTIEPSKER